MVRTLWASMGHDLQAQVESLKKLPPSFWQALKSQEKDLSRAAAMLCPHSNEISGSLQSCLSKTLDLEEPIILTLYAPLIRRLRSEWNEHALDFFVMVKAHISRLTQSIQMFSGDPALILRCTGLLQNFEKEVQEQPAVEDIKSAKRSNKASKKPVQARKKATAAKQQKIKTSAGKNRALALARIAKRSKPLVQKIEISRRRARR